MLKLNAEVQCQCNFIYKSTQSKSNLKLLYKDLIILATLEKIPYKQRLGNGGKKELPFNRGRPAAEPGGLAVCLNCLGGQKKGKRREMCCCVMLCFHFISCATVQLNFLRIVWHYTHNANNVRNGNNIPLHQYNVELYNVAVSSVSVPGSIVRHETQIKLDFLFPF